MDLFSVVNPSSNTEEQQAFNDYATNYGGVTGSSLFQADTWRKQRNDSLDAALGLFDGNMDTKDFFNAISGLDAGTKDYLTSWFIQEKLNKNAYDRDLKADSTKYQRAVKDLEKAGINPFMVLQGLGPGNVSSSAGSSSSGSYMSAKQAEVEQYNAILRLFGTAIAAIGAAAFGYAGRIGAAGIGATAKSFPRFNF